MRKTIRPIVIQGEIAYVPLTKGYTAVIDADMAEEIGQYNWSAFVCKNTVYACRNSKMVNGYRKLILLHREILDAPPKMDVDHINHDGLCNTKNNLRLCTKAQNQHNTKKRKNNTSGYKGVSFSRKTGKWVAMISCNGKQYNLGSFDTKHQAREKYIEAANDRHGQYAHTG